MEGQTSIDAEPIDEPDPRMVMAKKKGTEPTQIRPADVDPQSRLAKTVTVALDTPRSTSRSASISGACTTIGWRACAPLWPSPASGRYCHSTSTTSVTRPPPSSASGPATKLTRYSLLTGNGDPYIGIFGSAAKHHRLHAPWLQPRPLPRRPARIARRGRGDITLFRDAAKEIKGLLDAEGVGDMPLGLDVVEPPMLFELRSRASKSSTGSR